MDYHMHLVERGGAEVNKKSFIRWRGNGIAFRVVEDNINEEDFQTNVTLLSGEGRSAGYWGDITSGPFMCHREKNIILKVDYNFEFQRMSSSTIGLFRIRTK